MTQGFDSFEFDVIQLLLLVIYTEGSSTNAQQDENRTLYITL
jgi:hypothetical protein